jgi:hypothetical protein
MNRLVRGSVILAAVALVGACGGLDTDGIDETVELVADPGVVFVNNTDSQAVFVEALNDLGQQLAGDFTVTNVGPGLNVNYDTAYAPRPGVDDLPVRVRYFVRGTNTATFVSSSFTVSANGQSVTIPVNITPANLPAVFSNLTPAPNDTITMTAPAPLKFTPASTITFGGTQLAVVTGISADSSVLSFVPVPGSNGVATVDNLVLPYLSAAQTLNTTDQINVPQLAGTDDFPTAPTIPIPATGETVLFLDNGGFNANATCLGDIGGPCRIYTFTLAAAQDFDFVATWQGTTDLGFYIYDSGFNIVDGCDGLGAGGGGQPEACTFSFAAGTYYIANDTFSAFYAAPNNVDPTWIKIVMTGL